MKLLTAAESRQVDLLSQQKYGVGSYALMTRAGESVAEELVRWSSSAVVGRGVLVIAGKGNNGGDGMVAARRLAQLGARARVVLLGPISALKGDAARACADFLDAGGTVEQIENEPRLREAFSTRPGIVIDAIFGTGLNANIHGLPGLAVELAEGCRAPVVAVDIASGVNSDTGAIMGAAVRASLTITFGFAKFGHVSHPGAGRCGDLKIVDIGFPTAALDDVQPKGRFLEAADVRPLIRPRAADSHKGTYGHPLIIAGAMGKSGAAVLASRAALRTGAGLVTAAIPHCVAGVVAAGQAELMTEPMPDAGGHFSARGSIERLRELLARKTALAFGPGVEVNSDTRELLRFLIAEGASDERPLLIDADGLNALAEMGCDQLRKAGGPIVLTPHPGEMARLLKQDTGTVNADRISAARRLCELTGAYCLLKGNRTVIASPGGVVYINSSGNPGMATPGMGDALSGILATLLGQGMAPLDAMALGVFIHGTAADRLARRSGPVGYLAGDLIGELPATLAALGYI
ncbi:MAG TPA: NAD(P)H-hydrate dehydratase [Candidatus Binataceae bacterium]|nr:NAD(P)H-hydrate dehydratase [Candidatus Binataceae bacterium]